MSGFFEEYKSLDNLCKDILESEKGVSEYIERMEKEERGAMIVADWTRDYKKLKSMRYIRNKLAHDDGAYESDLCTDNDIAWVRDFQARIMSEEDPLTVLYNYDNEQSRSAVRSSEKPQKAPRDSHPDYAEPIRKPAQSKKSKSPQRKKRAPEAQPETSAPSFKPSFDRLTAIAAVLLTIGVIAALIVSCLR